MEEAPVAAECVRVVGLVSWSVLSSGGRGGGPLGGRTSLPRLHSSPCEMSAERRDHSSVRASASCRAAVAAATLALELAWKLR